MRSIFRCCPSRRFPFARLLSVGLFVGGAGLTGLTLAQEPASRARWVSDELSTYVRSGPTDEYRIVGTLRSGQAVELLQTRGSYSQVRGEDGEAVWIRSADLQEQPSQLTRVPALEQQVAELSNQLTQIDESWQARVKGMQETLAARKTLIDELQAQREALNAQLVEAQSDLREVEGQLGAERQALLMRYLAYGGSIAGAGLLVGLILPLLFRRRKRSDRWF